MAENESFDKGEIAPLQEPSLTLASCFVCTHAKREEIEGHYLRRGRHLGRTARKFGILETLLKAHVPHISQRMLATENKAKKDPNPLLRQRVRNRAATLYGYMTRAAEGQSGIQDDKGNWTQLPVPPNLETVAKIAEVMRRYDEMLLKLHEAPGFGTKGTTKIDAPESKFVIVQGQLPSSKGEE